MFKQISTYETVVITSEESDLAQQATALGKDKMDEEKTLKSKAKFGQVSNSILIFYWWKK